MAPLGFALATVLFLGGAALEAQAAPAKAAASGGARVEEVAITDRIEADGTMVRRQSQSVTMLDAAGVAQYSQVGVVFLESTQVADFEKLRVVRPDGREVDLLSTAPRDVASVLPPQLPIHSDIKVLRLAVPALSVGDRLTFESVVRVRPLVKGIFWTGYNFALPANAGVQRYELDLPLSLRVNLHARAGLTATFAESRDGSRRKLSWSVRAPEATSGAAADAGNQDGSESEPDLIFSSFESWDELAAWWGALAPPTVDGAVRRKADQLTAGRATPREKLAAIERFVAAEIRYLALPLGIGRFKARSPEEILRTGLGDCKDKHRLLASLARAVDIEVDPFLIASDRRALVDQVPSPDQFDHVISLAHLPGEEVWLDATSEMTPMGSLLEALRGRRGVLVTPGGGSLSARILTTPDRLPVERSERSETIGTVDTSGLIRARVRWTFVGDEEIWRLAFKYGDEAARRNAVELLREEWDQKTKIGKISAGDPGDLSTPFWIEYELEYKMTATIWDKPWDFWLPVPGSRIEAAPKSGSSKRQVAFQRAPRQLRVARFDLPGGVWAKAPVPVAVRRDFAEYRSDYRVEGHQLVVERELVRHVDHVGEERFGDLGALRKIIEDDYVQKFGLTATSGLERSADESLGDLIARCSGALDLGRADEAESLCRKAVETDGTSGEAWSLLGQALRELERPDEARAAFQRVLELDPNDEQGYTFLGWLDWGAKDLASAERQFRKQIEIAPLNAYAHLSLGRLMAMQGHLDEAEQLFTRAAKLDPENADAVEDLFHLAAQRNRPESIRALVREHPEAPKELDNFIRVAFVLFQSKPANWAGLESWIDRLVADSETALTSFDALHPGVDEIVASFALALGWEIQGLIALEARRYADAIPLLESALRLLPIPATAAYLATALRGAGRTDAANLELAVAAILPGPDRAECAAELTRRVPLEDERRALERQASEDSWKLSSFRRRIPAAARGAGSLWLTFGGQGRLQIAVVAEGSGLKPVAGALMKDPPSIPVPADNRGRIVVQAVASCSAEGDCTIAVTPLGQTWAELKSVSGEAAGRSPK